MEQHKYKVHNLLNIKRTHNSSTKYSNKVSKLLAIVLATTNQ